MNWLIFRNAAVFKPFLLACLWGSCLFFELIFYRPASRAIAPKKKKELPSGGYCSPLGVEGKIKKQLFKCRYDAQVFGDVYIDPNSS